MVQRTSPGRLIRGNIEPITSICSYTTARLGLDEPRLEPSPSAILKEGDCREPRSFLIPYVQLEN